MSDTVLEIEDLHLHYSRGFRRTPLHALRGVGLTVQRGETVAVVGESGSGKSTLGNAVLGIQPPSSGRITFLGEDITHSHGGARRKLGARLQAVFQDPYSSLNPVRTIGASLAEPLQTHQRLPQREVTERVNSMLDKVGLGGSAGKYPGQFSGGQRQRIAIARALMSNPELVVCDEPVSSLDVSVQAQVLNLLTELQKATGCSYLFISHNLTVVRHFASRVVVLYRGMVLEEGPVAQVVDHPQQPYTQALLAAVAVPDPVQQARRRAARTTALTNNSANALPDASCPFVPRCPHVQERCRVELPALRPAAGGARSACHFFETINAEQQLDLTGARTRS
jgi:oligopeptide/dipeptide ABC transporter ATP-binding protein